MTEDDYDSDKKKLVGCDFAVSKADKANRSSFTVCGQDFRNTLFVLDQYVGRWDPLEWIEVLFDIQTAHEPEAFIVEDGVIWKSLESLIQREMRERNVFLSIVAVPSVKDKATRGRSFQKKHRAKAIRFDKKAEWYAPYEHELLRFTGMNEAILDDQFDSSALASIGFDKIALLSAEDFMSEDELYERGHGRNRGTSGGRNATTGY